MVNTELVMITSNVNKASEFERLLSMPVVHHELDLVEIQSTDVAEVAKHKATEAYKQIKKPCFADDTGLTINAWGNLPGALIRWFLDEVGTEGVLRMLESFDDRTATVTTALAYCDEEGVKIFTGRVEGFLSDAPKGENGFGYDEIFVPDGQELTFAQMTTEQKDAISMRAIAATAMKDFLQTT